MLYTITMKSGLKICSLLFALFIVSCTPDAGNGSSSGGSKTYDIMAEQATSWNECLSQQEEHYLVYFYSPTCNPCQEIKGDVVSFASSNQVKTYFVDTSLPENKIQKCSQEEIVLGVSDVTNLYILGTPSLVEIQNGSTTSNVGGKSKCLELLNTLKTSNED